MDDLLNKSFNEMDIDELTIIINQVGRRILEIRQKAPNVVFWFGLVCRLSKWLNNEPHLNEAEKQLIIGPNPVQVNGRIRAIKHLRERTGMPLRHAATIVDEWTDKYTRLNSKHSL